MGVRNPFTAKLIMNKEQHENWVVDREAYAESGERWGEIADALAIMTPYRTAAYFEEFDGNSIPYEEVHISSTEVLVLLNGHSKAADRYSLRQLFSTYTSKFMFLVFMDDGEIPHMYSRGISSGTLIMRGLGVLQFNKQDFTYTNELESPEYKITGCNEVAQGIWESSNE